MRRRFCRWQMVSHNTADEVAAAPAPAQSQVVDSRESLAVWCSGLTKRFGRRDAVRSVSMEVRRGEVVGLLGANGAGKTTLIKMMLGLVRPDAGEVMLLGNQALIRCRDCGLGTYRNCSATSRGSAPKR